MDRSMVDSTLSAGRLHRRTRATHPFVAPFLLLAGMGFGAAVGMPWVVWMGVAGLAGYTLSGSV